MNVHFKLLAIIFACASYEVVNVSSANGSLEEGRGDPPLSRRIDPSSASTPRSTSSNDGPDMLQRALDSLPSLYGSPSGRSIQKGWVNLGRDDEEETVIVSVSDKAEKYDQKINELLEAQRKQLQEEFEQQLKVSNEGWQQYAEKKKEKVKKALEAERLANEEKARIEESLAQLRIEHTALREQFAQETLLIQAQLAQIQEQRDRALLQKLEVEKQLNQQRLIGEQRVQVNAEQVQAWRVQLEEAQRINAALEVEKRALSLRSVTHKTYKLSARKTASSPGYTPQGEISLDQKGLELLKTFSLAPGIQLVEKAD